MRLLVIVYLLLFIACQSNPSDAINAPETEAATSIATAAMTSQTSSAKPDSINPRYIRDSARPASEMSQQFPFDIPMTNAQGEAFRSNEIMGAKGKPTVLLFWLTTCYPCKIELKEIQKHYTDWQKEVDFELYAISTDFPMRYPRFQKYVNENKWPFPAFHDTNREFRKVMPGGLNGLPQVFVLDAAGEVVYHKRKYISGDEFKLFDKLKSIAATN